LSFGLVPLFPLCAKEPGMDEQTLNTIAEWELQEDMRALKNAPCSLAFLNATATTALPLRMKAKIMFRVWLHGF